MRRQPLCIRWQKPPFTEYISVKAEFEYDLTDINSISVGMASSLTINCKDGKKYKLTGMYNKKLIAAMEEAGVRKE